MKTLRGISIFFFVALAVFSLSGCSLMGGMTGGAATPFNGRDLNDWMVKGAPQGETKKGLWVVGKPAVSTVNPKMLTSEQGRGAMVNLSPKHGASLDIYSKEKFGDCRIELEVMVPEESNSGIYVMGEYEVQVLDSWGHKEMGPGDMGAIYGAAPPPVNASKAPGEWQKYAIEFRAPRFNAAGEKTENAKFIKVELNGQVLHSDLEMPGPTPGGVSGKEAPEGPIMFQGNHGAVAYRNIRVTPLQ